jgi:hypothetical protein
MRTVLASLSLVVPLLSQAASLNSANLVVNGGFEVSQGAAVGNGNWIAFAAASEGGNSSTRLLPGWTLDRGPGIEVRNNIAGSAFEGQRYVELDSFDDSSMSQWIQTRAGAAYQLSFAYSPRESVAADSNGIRVWWNEMLLAEVTAAGKSAGHDWKTFNYSVVGTGAQDRLRFASFEGPNVGSNSLGGSLDNVQLQAVPEPASLALALAALAVVSLKRRRS